MEITAIKTLIEKSFLPKNKKGELQTILVHEGATEHFFEVFDAMLAEEIDVRAKRFEVLKEKFDSITNSVDSLYQLRKAKLVEELSKQISACEISNLKDREKALDEYNSKLLKIQGEYEKKLKEAIAAITSAVKS